jgi:hypothetical protein
MQEHEQPAELAAGQEMQSPEAAVVTEASIVAATSAPISESLHQQVCMQSSSCPCPCVLGGRGFQHHFAFLSSARLSKTDNAGRLLALHAQCCNTHLHIFSAVAFARLCSDPSAVSVQVASWQTGMEAEHQASSSGMQQPVPTTWLSQMHQMLPLHPGPIHELTGVAPTPEQQFQAQQALLQQLQLQASEHMQAMDQPAEPLVGPAPALQVSQPL